MFHLTLVPLDGTHFAEHALPAAMLLARASGSRLLLAHVEVPPVPMDEPRAVDIAPAMPPDEYEAVAVAYLGDVSRRIRDRSGVAAEWIVLTGNVPQTVSRIAADTGADLIAMASHDRSAFGRMVAGSSGERVLRKTNVPVLLVRRSTTLMAMEAEADPAAVVDPIRLPAEPFRHVLVPLDGSMLAETVLQPATELARASRAAMTLLTVRRHRTSAGRPTDDAPVGYLADMVRKQQEAGLTVAGYEVHDTHVAEAIVRATTDVAADTIAMATHGRGGVRRLVYGSVAADVLHRVLMPVLVVRAGV